MGFFDAVRNMMRPSGNEEYASMVDIEAQAPVVNFRIDDVDDIAYEADIDIDMDAGFATTLSLAMSPATPSTTGNYTFGSSSTPAPSPGTDAYRLDLSSAPRSYPLGVQRRHRTSLRHTEYRAIPRDQRKLAKSMTRSFEKFDLKVDDARPLHSIPTLLVAESSCGRILDSSPVEQLPIPPVEQPPVPETPSEPETPASRADGLIIEDDEENSQDEDEEDVVSASPTRKSGLKIIIPGRIGLLALQLSNHCTLQDDAAPEESDDSEELYGTGSDDDYPASGSSISDSGSDALGTSPFATISLPSSRESSPAPEPGPSSGRGRRRRAAAPYSRVARPKRKELWIETEGVPAFLLAHSSSSGSSSSTHQTRSGHPY
ncbi:hypothetical protein BC834DRAFT_971968 [Gloeopeniophorella convolvens]|nr:hypothetical protein BC834DRAFT_971968 [Gloeopeniophorella convolvens]